MASGILGQSSPAATTNTTVYTVPADKTATFNVNCVNRGDLPGTVRLAVAAGSTPTDAEWIEYETSVSANGVLERTGIVAQAGKRIVAYASSAAFSFSVYGYEV